MKKFALMGVFVAVVAAISVVFSAGVASADPGNGNGAIVQHNAYGSGSCFVLGSGTTPGPWIIDDCVVNIVTTPSGVVNETLRGTVDPLTPPPSSAFTG
jgi:hypothetical protein